MGMALRAAALAAVAARCGAAAPRVAVVQFTMAKCPMTTTLHARFAKQVMSDPGLRAVVNFTQSFVGSPVGEGGDDLNETNWMECFHGPSECRGHTLMLCAREVSTAADPFDYRWYDMVTCMDGVDGIPGVTYNNSLAIPEDAEKCAAKVGLDWDGILACADGAAGPRLLHDSHFATKRLFAAHGGYTPPGHGYNPPKIPNVWIDGVEYNDPLTPAKDPYADLVGKVCRAYTGTPPAACAARRAAGAP